MTWNPYYDMDGEPIDALTWGRMFEDFASRMIARTEVATGVHVSTVWLGIDHRFGEQGPPLIYETMIFGGDHDEYCWRYPNRVAALAGHDQAVALASSAVHSREG